MRRRPPLLGRWLLRRALPAGVVAEGIVGDLEQEYAARPRRLWYVRQVVGIIVRSTHDRLRGRSWFSRPAAGPGGEMGGRLPGPVPGPAPGDTPGAAGSRRARRGEPLMQDLRFAVRTLAQRPLFTAVAIGTLAVGLGVNVAIFSVVNALLLRPVPGVEEPETIVEIARSTSDGFADVSWGAFQAVRTNSTTLDDVAGWDGITLAYRDVGDDEAQVLSGREVTGNYFSVLGVRPAAGRFFDPDRFWPDVAAEVVITHHVWQQRYGGADVIGREVLVNGAPATIIGVAPEGFGGHQVLVQRDIFVPIGMPAPGMLDVADLESVRGGFFVLLGRRADTASIEAVREELTVLGDRYYADHGISEPYRLRVDPYGGLPVTDRSMVALVFGLMMLITAMVMAIACVNVANMLLSRGLERQREIAIRMSLGAGRWRVARQLLTESMLLFVLAAAAAVALSAWTTDLLVRLYLPRLTSVRLLLDVSVDARVLAFAIGTAAVSGVVFGLTPALGATRGGEFVARGSAALRRAPRLRSTLVAGQMVLATVLLVAAGLMARTLAGLQSIDLGFDVEGVYLVELDLEHAGYDVDETRVFYGELLESLRTVPGISAVATARKPPMASVSGISGIYPDGVGPPEESGYSVDFNRVSDDYFRTVGIELLAGREFTVFDDEQAPSVAIVNRSMATRIWGTEAIVGKRFTVGSGAAARRYEIVGVAADANYHTFVEETPNFLYLAAAQSPDTIGHVMIRGDLSATVAAVRAAISAVDTDVPVVEVAGVRQIVDGFSMGQQLAAWVSGVVGLLGLFLGAVGVYGVTAFAVGQRSHEIGVRMALGARASDVRRLMLRSGMRAPLTGMAVGVLVSAAAAHLIRSFLHDVGALDPWTYGTVAGLLGAVALAATLVPAHRAATMDPVETLRAD